MNENLSNVVSTGSFEASLPVSDGNATSQVYTGSSPRDIRLRRRRPALHDDTLQSARLAPQILPKAPEVFGCPSAATRHARRSCCAGYSVQPKVDDTTPESRMHEGKAEQENPCPGTTRNVVSTKAKGSLLSRSRGTVDPEIGGVLYFLPTTGITPSRSPVDRVGCAPEPNRLLSRGRAQYSPAVGWVWDPGVCRTVAWNPVRTR